MKHFQPGNKLSRPKKKKTTKTRYHIIRDAVKVIEQEVLIKLANDKVYHALLRAESIKDIVALGLPITLKGMRTNVDVNVRTPIPLDTFDNETLLQNNSVSENQEDLKEVEGDTGGDECLKDGQRDLLLDSQSPERQNTDNYIHSSREHTSS